MSFIEVLVLIFSLASTAHHSSAGTWCSCREGLPDSMLQKTLDYACGAGADCVPIHQKGPCFQPNTVRSHCSYAVNSYFQRKRQAQGTCDFTGTAKCTSSDPSFSGCKFPSSASSAGTTSGTPTPAAKTPPATTSPPSTTMPPTNTTAGPYTIASPDINAYPNHGGFRPAGYIWSSILSLSLLLRG
ncbi:PLASMODESMATA CALLOSE-BINDING PROTEIN 3-like [Punica granatum]|uniref:PLASMODESMATA CALLOSE-BINDING PROTEIN 3-like n=2 Tax=Punica granatum TaxID=22663 RepID=A0A6P8BWJ4_PUNGR|nr:PLASMODESMATA CALLOSE-BINDING PROTEIN 3-like [Punica granatum]PKI77940.1 hypothetical protein CRG98_001560 [Punica granatum]